MRPYASFYKLLPADLASDFSWQVKAAKLADPSVVIVVAAGSLDWVCQSCRQLVSRGLEGFFDPLFRNDSHFLFQEAMLLHCLDRLPEVVLVAVWVLYNVGLSATNRGLKSDYSLALSNLEKVKELLLLVEKAPRCACGGNCETLKFLATELLRERAKMEGWR